MSLNIIDISVIICCYNSLTKIVPTLEHLSKQKIQNLTCELLIIDNNCEDNTVQVSLKEWEKLGNPFPMIILKEKKPGLSSARKAGIEASVGKIIIFCDDDNWLCPNYIYDAFCLINCMPKIGLLGGWSMPVFEIEKPNWFDEVSTSYACGGYVDEKLVLTNFVWGAGMVIRNQIAKEIFKIDFISEGRIGNLLNSGDDMEICERVNKLGYKIYKSNNLYYQHFISKDRLSTNYLIKLYIGFGYCATKKSFLEYNKPMKYITIQFVRTIFILLNVLYRLIFKLQKSKTILCKLDLYILQGNWMYLYHNIFFK